MRGGGSSVDEKVKRESLNQNNTLYNRNDQRRTKNREYNRNVKNKNNNDFNSNEADPSFMPGTATLEDLIDRKLMVLLRDGRKLIGVLRSYDQFANLVLHDTIERIFVGNEYADLDRGLFLVRGENVVLIGQCRLKPRDDEVEDEAGGKMYNLDDYNDDISYHDVTREVDDSGLVKKPLDYIMEKHQVMAMEKDRLEKMKQKILVERGFSFDPNENDSCY